MKLCKNRKPSNMIFDDKILQDPLTVVNYFMIRGILNKGRSEDIINMNTLNTDLCKLNVKDFRLIHRYSIS